MIRNKKINNNFRKDRRVEKTKRRKQEKDERKSCNNAWSNSIK